MESCYIVEEQAASGGRTRLVLLCTPQHTTAGNYGKQSRVRNLLLRACLEVGKAPRVGDMPAEKLRCRYGSQKPFIQEGDSTHWWPYQTN